MGNKPSVVPNTHFAVAIIRATQTIPETVKKQTDDSYTTVQYDTGSATETQRS